MFLQTCINDRHTFTCICAVSGKTNILRFATNTGLCIRSFRPARPRFAAVRYSCILQRIPESASAASDTHTPALRRSAILIAYSKTPENTWFSGVLNVSQLALGELGCATCGLETVLLQNRPRPLEQFNH